MSGSIQTWDLPVVMARGVAFPFPLPYSLSACPRFGWKKGKEWHPARESPSGGHRLGLAYVSRPLMS
ncbi:hypothetical protein MLD38_016076 [Melastoma candidum]|uniref:Uncharacterized protein n=1 Tax=Melastoma candidum TaxID=119954 RepID=A0ACB9RLB3_9MYRT|nr:hypothetical protein MLD38_016076 [Melastoma candidum]